MPTKEVLIAHHSTVKRNGDPEGGKLQTLVCTLGMLRRRWELRLLPVLPTPRVRPRRGGNSR